MSATLAYSARLSTIVCAACGMEFGAPEDWVSRRREDHASFYCPAGHAQQFLAETDAEKLRKELARRSADLVEAQARAVAAEKKLARVAHGVCPKCKRSFRELERHMATKHKARA